MSRLLLAIWERARQEDPTAAFGALLVMVSLALRCLSDADRTRLAAILSGPEHR
jgi:hypothetical protein